MLNREVNHSASYLHGFVEARKQGSPLLDQNERTELALVILKQELSSFELDFGVASGHTNVVNSEVALVATAQFEDGLVG